MSHQARSAADLPHIRFRHHAAGSPWFAQRAIRLTKFSAVPASLLECLIWLGRHVQFVVGPDCQTNDIGHGEVFFQPDGLSELGCPYVM